MAPATKAAVLLLGVHVVSATVDLDVDLLAESLSQDSDCALAEAEGDENCAFHALQVKAGSMRVDMESDEGAELIEAFRSQYDAFDGVSAQGSCAEYGCGSFSKSQSCQCNEDCEQYEGSCCHDFRELCPHNGTLASDVSDKPVTAKQGIEPPTTPLQYNGISWPELVVASQPGEASHIFAIGDWGGMDGELVPPDNLRRMTLYRGDREHGPHVFPRSRKHGCPQGKLIKCFNKQYCAYQCGFAHGVDDQAQLLVASQMKARAAENPPEFILNVGDNFYWGGIAKSCGHPMNAIHEATKHQFDSIFEEIYTGPGLDGKVWLSVLGNHDWGGRQFTAGWDQQIAYTWASDRWRMPALYWHQPVRFADYTVDVYMLDTNVFDAHQPQEDKDHNLCGAYNKKGATCAAAGGPESTETCSSWFQSLWKEQNDWLNQKLPASVADWQIIVTHFPCNINADQWRDLHNKHGLDLLVTGHRHDQELHKAHSFLGGLTCFVTGGGGGITSERSPLHGRHGPVGAQYGFFDLSISKTEIKVESIDHTGKVVDATTVYPKNATVTVEN